MASRNGRPYRTAFPNPGQSPEKEAIMTTPVPPGWYADPSGRPGQKYWDGSKWNATPTAPPVQGGRVLPPEVAAASQRVDQNLTAIKDLATRVPPAAWTLYAGLIVAAMAAIFLPFATVTQSLMGMAVMSQSVPASVAGKFIVCVIAAAAAFLAWPIVSRSAISVSRMSLLSIAVGLLAAFGVLVVVSNDILTSPGGDDALIGADVSPGFGLIMYGIAVIATATGVVMAWAHRSGTQRRPT